MQSCLTVYAKSDPISLFRGGMGAQWPASQARSGSLKALQRRTCSWCIRSQ